LPTSLQMTR